MAGEQRTLVKAAKHVGLRDGGRGQRGSLILIDAEGRQVWQGMCRNSHELMLAKRDLRTRGFDVR